MMDERVDDFETKAGCDAARLRFKLSLFAVGILLAISGVELAFHWSGSAPPKAAPALPAVTVSKALQRETPRSASFTGQFSAADYVELRAQVSGYLREIHFTDGQIVHKGDLLFVIDPRPFEIQLQQATAQQQTAAAQLELAGKQIARAAELKRNEFATAETLDQRTQQQRSAQAALEQAKAAIKSAQLNLEFSRITAPMTGRISNHNVSIGNLINGGASAAGSTLLTTIVSLDPIHLDFDMSESDFIGYQRFLQSERGKDVDGKVELKLMDERGWDRQGALDFLDNRLDRGSGTIHARATVANPDLFIFPGQFARLRLPVSAPRPVLLVPDEAIVTDQSRKLVMTVTADGTVIAKPVTVGELSDGLRVITEGLEPTDPVVINGLMRARPGAKVTAQPGSIQTAAQR